MAVIVFLSSSGSAQQATQGCNNSQAKSHGQPFLQARFNIGFAIDGVANDQDHGQQREARIGRHGDGNPSQQRWHHAPTKIKQWRVVHARYIAKANAPMNATQK